MTMTGKEPFGELESDEVEARFSAAESPDTGDLLFGEVMQNCWRGRTSIEEICSLVETSIQQMQDPDQPWSFFGEVSRLSSRLYATCLQSIGSVLRGQTRG